ncbi:MAG: aquaporin [Saprospiraceae bacterium]|nr:aquaporin [Saprospiraceae bacterium]
MATKPDNTGAFRKYVVEFFGTFFLVMTLCMLNAGDHSQFGPMAAGVMLIAMMYGGYHISGGHFNPAVSVATYLRGKLNSGDLLPYIVAQFLGGTLASMLAGFLLSATGAPVPSPKELEIVPALIAELLGTLLFVYVFLNLTTIKKTAGNAFYGIAIGFTFMAILYTFTDVSGGAFNPAVALGITMANLTSWETIWIFPVANFVGGILAAFLSQYVNGPEA